MNIQFDDSSQWQQGISALTLDVPKGEEDVPFTPEELQERTVPRRTIVSSTKTTMRTSTRNIKGRKVTTTVVVEEATPEELEKANLNGSSEKAKEEPQDEEPQENNRGRRSLVEGVLRGITRSLSRAGSLRSLGRGKGQGSDKKKDKKKKKEKKDKTKKAYFRADGKLVRRVKKKKGTEAEEPAKTDNQSDSEEHSDPEPSQEEEVEEEEAPNVVSTESSPEADAPVVVAADITTTAAEEQPVPLIGPSPNPNQPDIQPSEEETPSMSAPFIGPALHPDIPIQYHAPKPADTPIIGPVCGPQPFVAPAELPNSEEEEPVAFIGPLPQPQPVASKQPSAASTSNRQCETRALLSAALMARATASAPPDMVQRSQDLVHNPPQWKDKATAAATEASTNKMQPDTSEGGSMPDWKLRAMVQRSKARASGVVPEWRERAAAAASQASTQKQNRSSFVAMAPATDGGMPEWKRKLLEKKRAKLLELEQAKKARERVC